MGPSQQSQAKEDASKESVSYSSFDLKLLSFPSNLLEPPQNNEFNNNYVVFYITVTTATSISSDSVNAEKLLNRYNGPAAMDPADTNSAYNAAVGIVVAAGAGRGVSWISRTLGEFGEPFVEGSEDFGQAFGDVASTVITGLGTVISVPVSQLASVIASQIEFRTLKHAIALPMPRELSANYSIGYDAISTAKYQKLASPMTQMASTAGLIRQNIGLATPELEQFVSRADGTIVNNRKEQVFQDVNFREFTFSYTLNPKNASEAATIQNIVQAFKYHMHPGMVNNNGAGGADIVHNILYTLPSEFDIKYFNGSKINKNIHSHTSCVLKDLKVTYGENDSAYMSYDKGIPSCVNLSLTFVELALLNKAIMNVETDVAGGTDNVELLDREAENF